MIVDKYIKLSKINKFVSYEIKPNVSFRKSSGKLFIPTGAVNDSLLFEAVKQNCVNLGTGGYDKVAQGLGVNFGQNYGDLLISSGEGWLDRLGLTDYLTVSNYRSEMAAEAPEPGDTGATMGLAQHIMKSLPGEWQITPEPIVSR